MLGGKVSHGYLNVDKTMQLQRNNLTVLMSSSRYVTSSLTICLKRLISKMTRH